MLVLRVFALGPWTGSCALLPASMAISRSMNLSLVICSLSFTGSPPEQRITHRLAALIWRCLLGLAPVYLRELCCTPLSAGGSRSLRSSEQGLLQVPFARTSIRQNRAFSVLGPSTWNGLPLELRLLPRSIP